ncbi:MAG TPA: AglZ/HisF2 family acetamidino modification protein [Vicinamibacteria bacterium]
MLGPRVIPVLLLGADGLVKTVRFGSPRYVGDPINAVRIFNEKEVDELVLLDLEATPAGRPPRFELVEQIAQECFMPLCYGGGVRSLDDMQALVKRGAEKIAVTTRAVEEPELVSAAAERFGSSSVVVGIDVKRSLWRKPTVWTHGGRKNTGRDPVAWAVEMEKRGAGEILLNSIDRDGTMGGYDAALVKEVAGAVGVPVIACGGAGSVGDLLGVLDWGASAAAAGSLFVFQGKHRAVLISYPTPAELRRGA